MARIRSVDSSAKGRLKQRTKGYEEREPYRRAILSLSGDGTIELEPESGETLRKIKLNLARAAKEVGRPVKYGETTDNKILAWLTDSGGIRRRRGRRPKAATG
ncbi:MAG TPA: hypothetical protein VEQ11_21710 [Chloroflexota bacterium]|nr:hypothetical protein [Chloroflexota bacterium]